ncbi:MAG: Bacterial regulatory protein luxR family [Cyanobacteriota bacterium]
MARTCSLSLLAKGLTNREIAEQLFTAPSTARDYVSVLIGKFRAGNRVEVAARAVELGYRAQLPRIWWWNRHRRAIKGVAAQIQHDPLAHAARHRGVPALPGAVDPPVLAQAGALHRHGRGG